MFGRKFVFKIISKLWNSLFLSTVIVYDMKHFGWDMTYQFFVSSFLSLSFVFLHSLWIN